jgi:hypothetical protein
MPTEKEANLAREKHTDYLRKSGAHAIAVDKVKDDEGKETFGVVAYYEKKPEKLPSTLEVETEGKRKEVPLRSKISPMAQLE